jgi:hypothetical protein
MTPQQQAILLNGADPKAPLKFKTQAEYEAWKAKKNV